MRAGSPILGRTLGKALAAWLALASIAVSGFTPTARCFGAGATPQVKACGETRACCCQSRTTQKPACCCQVKEAPASQPPLKPVLPVPVGKWIPAIPSEDEGSVVTELVFRATDREACAVAGLPRSRQSLFCTWQA